MDKTSIRKRIIKERKLADPFLLNLYSQIIISQLFNDDLFKNATHIALYYPIHQEVNTIPLIAHLLNLGKHIYLPKVINDSMEFYEIFSLDDLVEGSFHTKEPISDSKRIKQDMDVMIVPLVAFNENNYRIGYGKGFYDRYLSNNHHLTIGLAYSFQKADFEQDSFDIPLTKIITETD